MQRTSQHVKYRQLLYRRKSWARTGSDGYDDRALGRMTRRRDVSRASESTDQFRRMRALQLRQSHCHKRATRRSSRLRLRREASIVPSERCWKTNTEGMARLDSSAASITRKHTSIRSFLRRLSRQFRSPTFGTIPRRRVRRRRRFTLFKQQRKLSNAASS